MITLNFIRLARRSFSAGGLNLANQTDNMVKHFKKTSYPVIILLCILFISFSGFAQKFTRQDTLRGSITPERAWWDVTRYNIDVKPDYKSKTISGNRQKNADRSAAANGDRICYVQQSKTFVYP
jgi:hypothetical protein